jgi:hypothetical protein
VYTAKLGKELVLGIGKPQLHTALREGTSAALHTCCAFFTIIWVICSLSSTAVLLLLLLLLLRLTWLLASCAPLAIIFSNRGTSKFVTPTCTITPAAFRSVRYSAASTYLAAAAAAAATHSQAKSVVSPC